jgi:YbgC/YbaW family acyl-CoA thioester hydrolase
MAFEYRYRRTVQFAETDMAGIVHFSRYFQFVEEAEHAFLRSIGLGVHVVHGDYAIGFPRVSTRCDFLRPLRFENEVEIHIWVHRKGHKSLTYHAVLSTEGGPVARAEIVVLCCRCLPEGTMETTPVPDAIADALEEAPYPPLEFGRRGI